MAETRNLLLHRKKTAARLFRWFQDVRFFLVPFRMPAVLRVSQEIEIRQLAPEHAGVLFEAIAQNRDHLARYVPWVSEVLSEADAKRAILTWGQSLFHRQGWAGGIYYKGLLAGMLDLRPMQTTKVVSMGYWLRSDMQGRGLVTTAAAELIQYCTKHGPVNTLYIRSEVSNERSKALARRLGFQVVGPPVWFTPDNSEPVLTELFVLARTTRKESVSPSAIGRLSSG